MAQNPGRGDIPCDYIQEEIEILASSDAAQHIPSAWHVLQHVYGGKEPLHENVICPPCYVFLKERGPDNGVITPSGEIAKDLTEYMGMFTDAMNKAKQEDEPKVFAEWLKACHIFWRKQFEEEYVFRFGVLNKIHRDNPDAFGPPDVDKDV